MVDSGINRGLRRITTVIKQLSGHGLIMMRVPIHNSTGIMMRLDPMRDRGIPSCQQSAHHWRTVSRVHIGTTRMRYDEEEPLSLSHMEERIEINTTQLCTTHSILLCSSLSSDILSRTISSFNHHPSPQTITLS